jgi:hypothetical protein
VTSDDSGYLVRRLEVSRVSDKHYVGAAKCIVRIPHRRPERHLPSGFTVDQHDTGVGDLFDDRRRYRSLTFKSQRDAGGDVEYAAQPLAKPGPPENSDHDRSEMLLVYGENGPSANGSDFRFDQGNSIRTLAGHSSVNTAGFDLWNFGFGAWYVADAPSAADNTYTSNSSQFRASN